jgi:urea transport system permease protein
MNTSALVSNLFNSISLASILLLIALGLAITFGLMRVINMAHGEFIMAGAYAAYVMQTWLGDGGRNWAFLVAIPFAFLVTAAMGWLLEITVIRRLYGRPLDTLLATWGISLMLQQGARSLFGPQGKSVQAPAWLGGNIALGSLVMPYNRLFIMALALSCLFGMCISTRRVDALAFAIGSGLAGVAGCALTLLSSIDSNVGTKYIVDSFMVVVLGGVGQLAGAFVGALGMGALNTLWEYQTTASLGKVLTFVCVIAFLQWRPAGIIATRSRALD